MYSSISNTVRRLIKCYENPNLIILYILKSKITQIVPDNVQLSLLYKLRIGKRLNLKHPNTFNEKLQWLKLNDRNPHYTSLVDKFEVRKFIAQAIGEKYLIPLLGVYDTVDEIDFDQLPDQFVLKPNHTSGNVIICKDKQALNIQATKKEMKKWLKREYYWFQREWPYKNIKPRIVCEELLVDETQEDLIDYKILCFNGVPKCLFLCLDRSKNSLKVDFYDLDWNPLPFERHYPRSGRIVRKPDCLEEMLELSRTLSADIPFVRVDFYEVNKKAYFGELTFYPGSGFEEFSPDSYDTLLGSWIDLSLVKKNP